MQTLRGYVASARQAVGAMRVAEQDGLIHIVDTTWAPGTPERERAGIRSARARCKGLLYDKRPGEFFDGMATCLRCIVYELQWGPWLT